MLLFCLLILGFAASAEASPCGSFPFCSKTFHGSGKCTGNEVLARLKDSNGWPDSEFVRPWEPYAIKIVGVQLVMFEGTPQYMLAGNSYVPDIMAKGGPKDTRVSDFYPNGYGFLFPAAKPNGKQPHIDLHVSCLGGGSFQVYYTVYYVPLNSEK